MQKKVFAVLLPFLLLSEVVAHQAENKKETPVQRRVEKYLQHKLSQENVFSNSFGIDGIRIAPCEKGEMRVEKNGDNYVATLMLYGSRKDLNDPILPENPTDEHILRFLMLNELRDEENKEYQEFPYRQGGLIGVGLEAFIGLFKSGKKEFNFNECMQCTKATRDGYASCRITIENDTELAELIEQKFKEKEEALQKATMLVPMNIKKESAQNPEPVSTIAVKIEIEKTNLSTSDPSDEATTEKTNSIEQADSTEERNPVESTKDESRSNEKNTIDEQPAELVPMSIEPDKKEEQPQTESKPEEQEPVEEKKEPVQEVPETTSELNEKTPTEQPIEPSTTNELVKDDANVEQDETSKNIDAEPKTEAVSATDSTTPPANHWHPKAENPEISTSKTKEEITTEESDSQANDRLKNNNSSEEQSTTPDEPKEIE